MRTRRNPELCLVEATARQSCEREFPNPDLTGGRGERRGVAASRPFSPRSLRAPVRMFWGRRISLQAARIPGVVLAAICLFGSIGFAAEPDPPFHPSVGQRFVPPNIDWD